VLSNLVFSSFADAQNSVTSKPLVRWGCISNQWKAGRVFQLFRIQLREGVPPEQPQMLFSFHCCNLSRLTVFSNPVILQKTIAPKPWIGWEQVNTRWKAVDVLYLFGMQFSTRFQKKIASDFNLLTVARSQDRIIVVIRFFLFGGDVAGLSVAICYGDSKCYEPTHNLVTIIESFLWWLFIGIMLPSKIALDATSSLRKIVVLLPRNLSGRPLVQNLANLLFWVSLSKVGCR
jgi:hypothetical protein